MFGTESGDRGEVHAHKDTTCFSLVWVLQRPPARTLQNAIIDSQQVEKKEGRKQTEILLKKDFDVEVGLEYITVDAANTVYDSRENCNAIVETATNTMIAGGSNSSFPASVTKLAAYCFIGNKKLTSIHLPASVKSIGSYCFSGCPALESITVDAANTLYDSRENCNAIIETAGNKMRLGCKNTVIPASVT